MGVIVLLSLAFTSGLLAFLGPCGIALLPAYIFYVFGREEEKSKSKFSNIFKGFSLGLIASLGIITVYLSMGLVFSFGGIFIKPYLPFIGLLVGFIVIILGFLILIRKFPHIPFIKNPINIKKTSRKKSFYLFGAGYGITQLNCTLPIFLVIVFEAIALGNLLGGMLVFSAYAIGMSTAMVGVTIGSFAFREVIQKYIRFIVPHITRITGIVLILAGLYQVYFEIVINQALLLIGL